MTFFACEECKGTLIGKCFRFCSQYQDKINKENKMTIDFTKPVQTKKYKYPVKILTTEVRGLSSVLGYIGDGTCLCGWNSEGKMCSSGGHENDLENVPEKKVMYVNVYMDGSSRVCDLKEEVIKLQSEKCIACIRIEYTEGQFDE